MYTYNMFISSQFFSLFCDFFYFSNFSFKTILVWTSPRLAKIRSVLIVSIRRTSIRGSQIPYPST